MEYLDIFMRVRAARLDAKLAFSRSRIRQQVQRVRQTRREAGDTVLALTVLRYLRRSYSDLVWLKRQGWPTAPDRVCKLNQLSAMEPAADLAAGRWLAGPVARRRVEPRHANHRG